MKCIYNFYIVIIVLTKIEWVVSSSAKFDDMELKHLSHQLNPIECLRLLEAMYLKRSMTDEEYEQSETKIPLDDESLLRRQLERPFLSHENCRVKLEEWRHNLPEKSNRWARVAMETVLRTLGRPDLAKYVKRNRRVVQYFEEDRRLSRNAAKQVTTRRLIVSKPIQVTPPERKYKDLPKEAVIQTYHTPEEAKANRGKSIFERRGEIKGAHTGAGTSDDDDSTTRWTAFLILLGLIGLTILATVVFALYKNNAGRFFPIDDKTRDDCCPLADRLIRKPSNSDVDVEQAGSTASSRCGRRKKRGSSTQEQSLSPSSTCLREKCELSRKPKKKKFLKDRQQQARKLVNRRKRRCDKNCAGVTKNETPVPKIDKSTKTKQRETSEKSQQFANSPKPRVEIKKFHEKLANILKKDNPSCKCCKCSVFANEAKGEDMKISGKKNICSDDKCQKRRLKSIAELCLSSEEISTRKESEADSNRMKKKKKRKKKKKAKDRDKDTDRDKESEKTSAENSARSKDKRDSKITEKSTKRRKCDIDEACTKKTCTFRKSRIEENLVADNKV